MLLGSSPRPLPSPLLKNPFRQTKDALGRGTQTDKQTGRQADKPTSRQADKQAHDGGEGGSQGEDPKNIFCLTKKCFSPSNLRESRQADGWLKNVFDPLPQKSFLVLPIVSQPPHSHPSPPSNQIFPKLSLIRKRKKVSIAYVGKGVFNRRSI